MYIILDLNITAGYIEQNLIHFLMLFHNSVISDIFLAPLVGTRIHSYLYHLYLNKPDVLN